MRRRYGSGDIPRDAGGRRILSERVESVAYVHAHDGERYRHNFAAGVRAAKGRIECVDAPAGARQCGIGPRHYTRGSVWLSVAAVAARATRGAGAIAYEVTHAGTRHAGASTATGRIRSGVGGAIIAGIRAGAS
jgi:hypothetical protein